MTTSESSSEEIEESTLIEENASSGPHSPKMKRARRAIISTKLVASLDTCKVSDRDAVHILTAAAEAFNLNVDELVINRSSIRRCRERLWAEYVANLRVAFAETELVAVTIHWDGKMLPSLVNKELVDRLPVIATCRGTEHLLGVPSIPSGSGRDQAIAVHRVLDEWGLTDKVQAFCCDTTATNTGRLNGACILLEQQLEKDILLLPCIQAPCI